MYIQRWFKMDPQKVKTTPRRHRRSAHLTIRVSPDIQKWLREKEYSPTAIFYEAIRELGYKERRD
jgi:hypothetical protein